MIPNTEWRVNRAPRRRGAAHAREIGETRKEIIVKREGHGRHRRHVGDDDRGLEMIVIAVEEKFPQENFRAII